MGWLFMTDLRGHAGPREYLDAQFTYQHGESRCRVLRSGLVAMRTYYAAAEIEGPGRPKAVVGLVCLVRYNPRDREGYIFGYKDMDETMGPVESRCPGAILDLLTPTENEQALAWRARCRQALLGRASKPKLRHGQTVVFAEPLTFVDGAQYERLTVIISPRRPRAVRFAPVGETIARYRISNLKSRSYRVETAP